MSPAPPLAASAFVPCYFRSGTPHGETLSPGELYFPLKDRPEPRLATGLWHNRSKEIPCRSTVFSHVRCDEAGLTQKPFLARVRALRPFFSSPRALASTPKNYDTPRTRSILSPCNQHASRLFPRVVIAKFGGLPQNRNMSCDMIALCRSKTHD